jgi:hypothetical protein
MFEIRVDTHVYKFLGLYFIGILDMKKKTAEYHDLDTHTYETYEQFIDNHARILLTYEV